MWLHGNTGEPIVSSQITVNKDSPYQKILSQMETIASIYGAKKRAIVREVSWSRETEEIETGKAVLAPS